MREAVEGSVEGSVKETEQIRISSNLRDNEISESNAKIVQIFWYVRCDWEKIVKWTALWFILKLRYRI